MNPVVNEFLTAEYRLARLMTDVNRIIGEALDLWIDLDYVKIYELTHMLLEFPPLLINY